MVKGSIPSLQTWEERQGLSPPRFTSPPPSVALKRSRPVTSHGVRSQAGEGTGRPLLGHTEREVIIETRAETRQLTTQQPPPPPPLPNGSTSLKSFTNGPSSSSNGNLLASNIENANANANKTVSNSNHTNGSGMQDSAHRNGSAANGPRDNVACSNSDLRNGYQANGTKIYRESSDNVLRNGTRSNGTRTIGSDTDLRNGTRTNGGYSRSGCSVEGVETESLDSFTLEHPSAEAPKPPPTYFDGTVRRRRDVLVAIGAYGDNKPPPARLNFLGGKKRDSQDEGEYARFEEVTTQLQQELVETLTRANLRNRTGSVDNLLSSSGDGATATRRTVTDKYGSVCDVSDSGADGGPGGGILKHGQ